MWKERHEGIVPNKGLGRAEPGLAKKASGGAPQAARQRPRGERRGVQLAPVKHRRDSAD